ncbi:MAG: hypothetical protein L6437_14950, partial [Kiritimatiellae bacterium]|nr:hypothetical protein [Kiritimatiellia bacterium]
LIPSPSPSKAPKPSSIIPACTASGTSYLAHSISTPQLSFFHRTFNTISDCLLQELFPVYQKLPCLARLVMGEK